jgi:hypothetical protein
MPKNIKTYYTYNQPKSRIRYEVRGMRYAVRGQLFFRAQYTVYPSRGH